MSSRKVRAIQARKKGGKAKGPKPKKQNNKKDRKKSDRGKDDERSSPPTAATSQFDDHDTDSGNR